MGTRFISVDRDQGLLLPPDMREWVSKSDPVHFILAAVDSMPASAFAVNTRGSGSAQYPPSMMLALLVYCYSMGLYASRKIEQATYRDVGVRFCTADTHPDHDTICAFRRNNQRAIELFFLQVLVMAREMGLLKAGTVSVDGTLIQADASKERTLSYARACALEKELAARVRTLLDLAEQADLEDEDEGLPEDLQDPERLRQKVREARERMEARAKDHKEKMDRTPVKQRRGANAKRHPKGTPDKNDRDNLTDPDSRLMRKSRSGAWQQSYNAQAAVDADGSQLILATRISQSSNDGCELAANIHAIPEEAGHAHTVLADSGYATETEVSALEAEGIDVYASPGPEPKTTPLHHQHTARPPSARATSPFGQRLRAKLNTDKGRALYKRRKSTVEPVFGILKHNLGFTRFHLRGLENVRLEWQLIALAYNLNRLFTLKTQAACA